MCHAKHPRGGIDLPHLKHVTWEKLLFSLTFAAISEVLIFVFEARYFGFEGSLEESYEGCFEETSDTTDPSWSCGTVECSSDGCL